MGSGEWGVGWYGRRFAWQKAPPEAAGPRGGGGHSAASERHRQFDQREELSHGAAAAAVTRGDVRVTSRVVYSMTLPTRVPYALLLSFSFRPRHFRVRRSHHELHSESNDPERQSRRVAHPCATSHDTQLRHELDGSSVSGRDIRESLGSGQALFETANRLERRRRRRTRRGPAAWAIAVVDSEYRRSHFRLPGAWAVRLTPVLSFDIAI